LQIAFAAVPVLDETFRRLATAWKTEVWFSTEAQFCCQSHHLCVPPSLTYSAYHSLLHSHFTYL